MTTENWHQERDRLIQLLAGIESGTVSHIDQDTLRPPQAKNSKKITLLKDRVAVLNARLGMGEAMGIPERDDE